MGGLGAWKGGSEEQGARGRVEGQGRGRQGKGRAGGKGEVWRMRGVGGPEGKLVLFLAVSWGCCLGLLASVSFCVGGATVGICWCHSQAARQPGSVAA